MKSSKIQYSEAFAGSGEYAAVMLVSSIFRAKPKSLILLDEPEVSLHPAAQKGVMDFLAQAALRHHHQIVLATHAPEMVRRLPAHAIKVLEVRADDGRIDIPSQQAPAHAAFEAVGASYEHPTVVVEDRLAKALVSRAIKELPISESVRVKFIPGGADTLWGHYVPMWAQDDRQNLLLLLDGDQTTPDPPVSTKVASDDLEALVVSSLKGNQPKLPYGASEPQSYQNREDALRKVLDWRVKFVGFLPVVTPEEYLLSTRATRLGEPLSTEALADTKAEWVRIAESDLGRAVNGDEIFLIQEIEINKLDSADPALESISATVANFMEAVTP